jgi:hypothetical protein
MRKMIIAIMMANAAANMTLKTLTRMRDFVVRIDVAADLFRRVSVGSTADISLSPADVRFTPKTDIAQHGGNVRFVP